MVVGGSRVGCPDERDFGEFSNVTVRNGRQFGGVHNNGATLTIRSSTVSDSVNIGWGGGVFAAGGTTTIVDSIISDNETSRDLGGIGVDWCIGGTLTISDSLVTRNKANVVEVSALGLIASSTSAGAPFRTTLLEWGGHLQSDLD